MGAALFVTGLSVVCYGIGGPPAAAVGAAAAVLLAIVVS